MVHVTRHEFFAITQRDLRKQLFEVFVQIESKIYSYPKKYLVGRRYKKLKIFSMSTDSYGRLLFVSINIFC